MTVPNLMLKVFCYQDLRREGGREQIGLNPLGHDQKKIPKGYDKITRFCQDLYGYDLFLYP